MNLERYRGVACGFLLGAALSIAAAAQTPPAGSQFKILYAFSGLDNVFEALGPPLLGPNNVIYGATRNISPTSAGTVFELLPPVTSGGAWTQAVLHSFTTSPDEGTPTSIVMGSKGALFVETVSSTTGAGFVYQLAPPTDGGGVWITTLIYQFNSTSNDLPFTQLVIGPQNALFGLTGDSANGTIAALTPPASGSGLWTEKLVYAFPSPVYASSLTFAPDGTILITGRGGDGRPSPIPSAVYALSSSATTGQLTLRTLYTFNSNYDLSGPLVVHGNRIYGATPQDGGSFVFELSPPSTPGEQWTENTIYQFSGAYLGPVGPLLFGKNGVLYGETNSGNASVYALAPSGTPGTPWNYFLLHAFNGATDGGDPVGLALNSKGVLIGFTFDGGPEFGGTAFAIYPALPATSSMGFGVPDASR